MNKKALYCLMAAVVFFQAAHSQTFKMNVGESEVSLWRFSSSQKEQVKDSTVIGIGDTLFTSADQEVSIQLDAGTKLLVKGPGAVSLSGKVASLEVALEDGQVFLDRTTPQEVQSISIVAKGYSFTPVGTAMAVKTTRQGIPTTAVLKGKVQMLSPLGESITVAARQFGTVDPNGKLTSGILNEKGLQQLEGWSGVKAEQDQVAKAAQAKEAPVTQTASAAVSDAEEPFGEESQAQEPAVEEAASEKPAPAPAAPAEKNLSKEASAPAAAPVATPVSVKTAEPEAAEQGSDGAKAVETTTEAAPATPATPSATPMFSSPKYELGAGMVTVGGEQWTRIALGIDVPIWKFGVFLDLELFMDSDNKLSDKGWNFGDDWADALARKIRYVRFGHEEDPLFVKFGGLSDVTMGYGIIMDRFTNMLRYPDQKLLGLQVYLNDVSPLGIYMQSVISDFAEAKDGGGVGALRLAVSPLKMSNVPILKGLTVGGTYALDRNVNAPAKNWKLSNEQAFIKELQDSSMLTESMKRIIESKLKLDADEQLNTIRMEDSIRGEVRPFDIAGVDVGLPLLRSKLLSIDVYGQAASRIDDEGWGMGAPGVSVKLWKLWGNLEYRKIEGRFTPGFFDYYYLDERINRDRLKSKADLLSDVSLNGVFGRLGADLSGFITIEGSYQYLIGKDDEKDQSFEAVGKLGEQIVSRIPKISMAEIYVRNSKIGQTTKYYDDGTPVPNSISGVFDLTEYLYWGYRAGFEISPGASIVWDYRYGWKLENGKLVPDNNISLQTALTF